MRRIAQIIEVDEASLAEYRRLHADEYAGVRDLLTAHQLRNFSIHLHRVDGRWLEFAYLEYVGTDYDSDMAALESDPRYRSWLNQTDRMQRPLPGATGWQPMEEIFFNA